MIRDSLIHKLIFKNNFLSSFIKSSTTLSLNIIKYRKEFSRTEQPVIISFKYAIYKQEQSKISIYIYKTEISCHTHHCTVTSSRNNETRSRGSRSAGGRVPASPGRSVCATVGKNAAQGCFHVIFWIRPRPKGGVMNRRSGCNPIRGPRSIDGERKIDDREGEKKGKKKK